MQELAGGVYVTVLGGLPCRVLPVRLLVDLNLVTDNGPACRTPAVPDPGQTLATVFSTGDEDISNAKGVLCVDDVATNLWLLAP
jgi:hypothetical protein